MKAFLMMLTAVMLSAACAQNVSAEEKLAYAGQISTPMDMQSGGSPVTGPMQHSTDYGAQFPSYASFMQSPYTAIDPNYPGAAYAQSPYGYGQYGNQMMPQGANMDPYAAAEISPYSHYSPYIEVVGEGSDYALGIDDVVTVIVRNQPDFSGRYVVDPEGNIQYNFVGDIAAAGKTKEELKADITDALRQFVRFPEVAVMISQYRSKFVYVFGFVNAPGKYAMKGNHITVKEAIVAAGLPRMDGAMSRVYVIRPSEYTDSGEPAKKKVDLKKLLYKGESVEDFVLQPGDTIVVNQKYFDKFVNGFSRVIGPVFQASAVYELAYGDQDGYLQ